MAEILITASELASYAPDLDTSSYNATTISGMISRASELVRSYCSVDGFLRTAVENEKERAHINTAGELVVNFRRRPVSEGDVSAIRLRQVDVDVDLNLVDTAGNYIYAIQSDQNYLVYPSNFIIAHGRGLISLRSANLFYEVDYTGGYTGVENVPGDIKEAVTLWVRSMVARKYNPNGASSFSQGAYSMSFSSSKDGDNSFVREAKSILDGGGFVRRVHF